MQRSTISKYLSGGAVIGFLASDNSKQEKISDLKWNFTNDGEEDKKEIRIFM